MSKLFRQLKDHYRKGSFGIFVGAGLSQASGLPSWEQLLRDLIAKCIDLNAISKDKAVELTHLASFPDKYLMLAEELREILSGGLEKYIKEQFNSNSLAPSASLMKVLDLKSKFIVTTNYDKLIEKAFVKKFADVPPAHTYKEASTINYKIYNGEFFILKAHGNADGAPNELILTERDYRKVIYNAAGYQSVLHVLFSTFNLLFVGASLKDPELLLVLRYVHNVFHGGSPDHYALMNKNELTQVEIDQWRKDYNIHILPCDPKDNYKEVYDILEELATL